MDGKVALITGASKGIGAATARAMAKAGARLVLVARGQEALDAIAEECRSLGSPKVLPIAADVAKYEDLDRIIMSAVREFNGFDVLVNNAGIGSVKPIEDVSDEEYDHTMAVNLRAPFMLCQVAVKMMRRKGGGQIINIGSGLSYVGRADWSLYAASKFALRGLTECLRHECAKDGVKIALVAPGFTKTHFFDDEEGERDLEGALHPDDVAHAVMSVVTQPASSDIKEVTVRGPISP